MSVRLWPCFAFSPRDAVADADHYWTQLYLEPVVLDLDAPSDSVFVFNWSEVGGLVARGAGPQTPPDSRNAAPAAACNSSGVPSIGWVTRSSVARRV